MGCRVPALLAALSVLGPTLARAQDKPAAADATDDEKRAKAKELYDEGITAYNLGEFDKAIAKFKEAYALDPEPGFLFNIAQAYRLEENYKQALYFYRTYLRVQPDAPNKADVEHWISELEKLIASQKDAKEGQPTGPVDPQGNPTGDGTHPDVKPPDGNGGDGGGKVVLPPLPQDDSWKSRKRTLEYSGIAAAIGGGLFLGTGVVFSTTAERNWNEVNDAAAKHDIWTSHLQSTYDAAKSDEKTAAIFYIAGGAAVVTGGVLWYLGFRMHAPAQVMVVPAQSGAQVTASWTF